MAPRSTTCHLHPHPLRRRAVAAAAEVTAGAEGTAGPYFSSVPAARTRPSTSSTLCPPRAQTQCARRSWRWRSSSSTRRPRAARRWATHSMMRPRSASGPTFGTLAPRSSPRSGLAIAQSSSALKTARCSRLTGRHRACSRTSTSSNSSARRSACARPRT